VAVAAEETGNIAIGVLELETGGGEGQQFLS
jgi:hypothetical protein